MSIKMDSLPDMLMEVSVEEITDHYDNYLRVLDTILVLESEEHLGEDWYYEHILLIAKYRDVFRNFNDVNTEIDNIDFRRYANESEDILSHLINEISIDRMFTLDKYLTLNRNLKYMCEFIYEEDELTEMLRRMECN